MSNSTGDLFSFDLFYKEISIFFKKIFKKIVISIIVGTLFGAAVSLYSKNLIISTGSIGIVNGAFIEPESWEKFKLEIPSLINLNIENHVINDSELRFYKVMSNPDWWNKNTDVIYYKNPLSENNRISKIIVNASAPDEESARMTVITALNLVKSRGAYFSIAEKISDKNLQDYSQLMQSLAENNLSMIYILDKKKYLQKLQQNNGGNGHEGYYPLNLSEGYSKFLPLKTQILALDIDLYEKKKYIKKIDSYLAYRQYINGALNELQNRADFNNFNTFDYFSLINIFEQCIDKMTVEDKCTKVKYQILEIESMYKQLVISEVKTKTSLSFVFLNIIKYAFFFVVMQFIYQLFMEYATGMRKNEER